MNAFADSSALVKLYADEDGSDQVRTLASMAIAQIARVEVPAAVWRKYRLGEFDVGAAQVLTAMFEADYFGTFEEPPRFVAVATTSAVLDEAAHLCQVHGLRTYDAIQLASAITVRRVDDSWHTMAVFDESLRRAAAHEGFALYPR